MRCRKHWARSSACSFAVSRQVGVWVEGGHAWTASRCRLDSSLARYGQRVRGTVPLGTDQRTGQTTRQALIGPARRQSWPFGDILVDGRLILEDSKLNNHRLGQRARIPAGRLAAQGVEAPTHVRQAQWQNTPAHFSHTQRWVQSNDRRENDIVA
jgi:hypothetical protein